MILYTLNTILFSAAFWAVYQLLLKRETFFTANRVYLLAAPVLALVLPLLSFEFFQFGTVENSVFRLPVAELGKLTIAPETAERTTAATSQPFSLFQILIGIYAVGVLVSVGLFLIKLRNLQKLRKTGKRVPLENHGVSLGNRKAFIIEIPNSKIAFSFFNTIFLGDHYSETEKQQIAKHERVHMEQKHSWDLLFFEFLRIVLWFNPLVYVFQKDITEIHEFLADEKTAANQSKKTYAESLLNAGFGTRQLSFTNSFFTKHSLKTRLIMLYRSKSTRPSKLKFLTLIPLIAVMLVYVSCSEDRSLQGTDAKNSPEMETPPKPPKPTKPPKPSNSSVVYFGSVDQSPEFPDSSQFKSSTADSKGFSESVKNFVGKNFDVQKVKPFAGPGLNKIYVRFTIGKDGRVNTIKVKSKHPELADEAKRVIKKLPQLKPGENDGKPVDVVYTLPIAFRLN